uniref:Uncharacterized protein n=1 Tax=viral metagenome TaxID=1070528 RepID=A0A6C0CCB0_9ZZZZ
MSGKDDEKDSEQEGTVCPHLLKQRSGEAAKRRSGEAVRACERVQRSSKANASKVFAFDSLYTRLVLTN